MIPDPPRYNVPFIHGDHSNELSSQKGLLAQALKSKQFRFHRLLKADPAHNRTYRELQSYAHAYNLFYRLSKADMVRLGSFEVKRLFDEHQSHGSIIDLEDHETGQYSAVGIPGNDPDGHGTEGDAGDEDVVGEDVDM